MKVVVAVKDGVPTRAVSVHLAQAGFTVDQVLDVLGIITVTAPKGKTLTDVRAVFGVKTAEKERQCFASGGCGC